MGKRAMSVRGMPMNLDDPTNNSEMIEKVNEATGNISILMRGDPVVSITRLETPDSSALQTPKAPISSKSPGPRTPLEMTNMKRGGPQPFDPFAD